jgi:hypothetical protein
MIGGGVVLAVIVLWLVLGGDDEAGTPGGGATGDPTAEAAGGDDEPAGGGDDSADVAPAPPPVPVGPAPAPPEGGGRNGAVGGLSRSLREARLWSTVTGSGDGVLIESSFCDDSGLASIVDGAIAELRQVGFTSVRCRAPHGAVVFDRAL